MFEKSFNNRNKNYFINDKLFNLSQVTIFIIIISTILITVLTTSLVILSILLILLLTFSIYLNQFQNFIIKTLMRFKIFILLILIVSYFNNYSFDNLLFDFIKIYNILILSIIFNFIIDIDLLMNYLDFKLNNVKSKFIKINLRKLSFSFLLGVKFIPELFNFGSNINEIREIRGYKIKKGLINRLKGYTTVLIPLFITSFIKAQDLEKSLIIKGFSFERDRTLYTIMKFNKRDYITIVICFSSIVISLYI